MARGDQFKDPEVIKNRIEKRKANTEEMNKFYLNIDGIYFIERDAYNIILGKKCIADKTGNNYIQVVGYYSSFGNALFDKLEELNVNGVLIGLLKEKSMLIETKYEDGDLVIKVLSDLILNKRN